MHCLFGKVFKKSLVDISSCIPQSPTLKERSNSPWETMAVIGCLAGFVALENKSNNQLAGGRNRSSRVESHPFFCYSRIKNTCYGWNFRSIFEMTSVWWEILDEAIPTFHQQAKESSEQAIGLVYGSFCCLFFFARNNNKDRTSEP